MIEENSIENKLSQIGQRLVQIEQTIQESLGGFSKDQLHHDGQLHRLKMDEHLEVIRQEVDQILSGQERNC